jgi:hypothetical protein
MRFFVTIIALIISCDIQAQYMMQKNPSDSLLVKGKPAHSPKKAAIYSACLPGLGQVYNKKYWKVPIIYAGFAGLGYGFYFNHREFKTYRNALRYRYDDDPATIDNFPQYNDDNLVTLKNFYQRYRDLTVVGMVALCTLNVVDAAVDAHLFTFDVSDDLSMRIQPTMMMEFTPGIRCGLTIK